MAREIIPPNLAIKAMRDSGYKDAAHAVAELVDNSIQAGATNVEVLCADRVVMVDQRRRQNIDRIAVFDDGEGMDPTVLELALQFGYGTHLERETQDGIGKFGMGLPNSSISQCRRVDVWSWQDHRIIWTYLDVDRILAGQLSKLPEPVEREIPEEWLSLLSTEPGPSGTLVVWSKPDRIRWKTSRAFLKNSERILGRMYRHFISNGDCRIRLSAHILSETGVWEDGGVDQYCRVNDPLYLTNQTSTPPPFDGKPMFELFGEPHVEQIRTPDGTYPVKLTFSITKKKARELGGARPHGKHAAKNIGVSVVRAQRELELNQTFHNGYDPKERWWGVEVSFSPALDEVFGVSNNKQSATKFARMNLDEDAETEGMSPEHFRDELREEGDHRLLMYELSRIIDRNLKAMRVQIDRMREGSSTSHTDGGEIETDAAEKAATEATEDRARRGFSGRSDEDASAPAEQRIEEIAESLQDAGALGSEEARRLARFYVEHHVKYIFREGAFDGAAFFSVQSRGGEIIIHVNRQHPAAAYLYDLLEASEDENASKALFGLKLLFCAWARLEDEAQSQERRHALSDVRADWGRIARDFLIRATR